MGRFIEFDISVVLVGYECGRHAPNMGYVRAHCFLNDGLYTKSDRIYPKQ